MCARTCSWTIDYCYRWRFTELAYFAIKCRLHSVRKNESIEARQPFIRSVYKLTRRAEQDAAARDRLQNIAAEFVSF